MSSMVGTFKLCIDSFVGHSYASLNAANLVQKEDRGLNRQVYRDVTTM